MTEGGNFLLAGGVVFSFPFLKSTVMNRKIVLPAMMLVLTSMLATVIEATAKMGHNNKTGVCAKRNLVPMTVPSKAVMSGNATNGEQGAADEDKNVLQSHASILNLNALKAINGIIKELPEDHSTSFQG